MSLSFFFLFSHKKSEKSSANPRMSCDPTISKMNVRIWGKNLQERCPRNDITVERNKAKIWRFVEINDGLSLSQIVALFVSFCRLSVNRKKIVATCFSSVTCRQNPVESLNNCA